MDTIALYIGYIVIGLIALVLICFSVVTLYATAVGLFRITKYKKTSRFIKNHEAKAMYKTAKVAVEFLISKGVCRDNTLGEAENMIERFQQVFKVKED